VTELTQGHWQSYHSIGDIWFPICLLFNNVSILYHFRDIITYFPKLKDVTWPWPHPLKGQSIIPMIKHHMAKQCTKFDVSSFTRSGDILGGSKKLNGSRDHNHTSFGGDFFICLVRLDIAYLCTKFEISTFAQ